MSLLIYKETVSFTRIIPRHDQSQSLYRLCCANLLINHYHTHKHRSSANGNDWKQNGLIKACRVSAYFPRGKVRCEIAPEWDNCVHVASKGLVYLLAVTTAVAAQGKLTNDL